MSPVKPNKKTNTGGPGVKLLIAATSLAATVGGWALISAKETTPAPPAASAQVVAPQTAARQATAPVFSIKLAPLPTLVPVMSSQGQVVTVSNVHAASAPRPAAVAAQAAPQPALQPAPQPALVLRDVSAPAGGGASAGPSASAPAPATNTRSSK